MMRNGRHFTSQLHQSSALFRKHISNINASTRVPAYVIARYCDDTKGNLPADGA
jgi:hypothetical protein